MSFILRFSTITRGAITFTGNTLGLSRANVSPTPCIPGPNHAIGAYIINNAGINCGTYTPSPTTNGGTTSNFALNNSCNTLVIPPGSEVIYAELIWGGSYLINTAGGENNSAFINNPINFTTPTGLFSVAPETFFNYQVNANGDMQYIRSANVTGIVNGAGPGMYCAGGIVGTLVPDPRTGSCAGWTLGVIYRDPTLPFRSMTLYLGNVFIQSNAAPVTNPVANFQTPSTGPISARLLVSAQEGDAVLTGDFLAIGPNAGNLVRVPQPAGFTNNFFQSQIYNDVGTINPTATFGDRNATPGEPGTNNPLGGRQGWDIANVNVSSRFVNNQTSALVQIGTNGDQYAVNGLALQIDNIPPTFIIEKSDFPDPVTVGDNLTYTITISNLGDFPQTNVIVTDTLPPSVTFVSVTPSQGTASEAGGIVTANLGTILPGGTATVTIIVTPNVAGVISNTSSVVSDQGGPNFSSAITVVNPIPPPVLTITKEDFPDPVTVGNNLDYSITIANIGPTTATNVAFEDVLPPSVAFVSVTSSQGTISESGGIVTGNLGSIAPGGTVSIVITVIPVFPGTIVNTATVSSTQTGPVSATSETTVNALPPVLTIIKEDHPDPVLVGQNLVYTVTITNTGASTATNVVLSDTLPGGVTFVSAVPSQGIAFEAGGIVTGILGSIDPGGSATVTITVTPTAPGTITNTATVSSTETGPVTTLTTTTVLLTPEDLVITKVDFPDPVTVGEQLTYTITISNSSGVASLTNVIMTDQLDTTLIINSVVTTQGSLNGPPFPGNLVVNTIGTILPGNSVTVTMVVTPTVPGILTNVASVTSNEVPQPQTSTTDTVVNELPPPALTIVKESHPETVILGNQLVYHIHLSNAGPTTATNVNISDQLPPSFTFVSATTTQGVVNEAGGLVTANLGSLPSGETATVEVTVIPTATGTFTNTASVTSAETPEQFASVDTTVEQAAPPILQIAKENNPSPVRIGNELSYSISVLNTGGSPATNVVIMDPLPPGTLFKSVTTTQGTASETGGVVTANLGTILPGASASISIIVTTTEVGLITDTATAFSTELPPVSGSAEALVIPQLVISKIAAPNPAIVGQNLFYQIEVTNISPIPIPGVIVTDQLPQGVQFVNVIPSQGTASFAGGIVTADLGTIPANATATITIVVTPTAPGIIRNTATVRSTLTGERSESVVTTILPSPLENLHIECIRTNRVYDWTTSNTDGAYDIQIPPECVRAIAIFMEQNPGVPLNVICTVPGFNIRITT